MPFCDIYGQNRQISVIQSAIKRERVPHAYLFHGVSGIGKRTAAYALAKALNCQEDEADFCGKCVSCQKAAHGTHPDIIVIEPEGIFIKIEKIRDLQKQTQYRPLEGRKKIFILAEADRMNDASANALLKTLEEPNPSNIIILTTSRIHKLPQTIISRCQKIRFQPLRAQVVASFLADSLSVEKQSALEVASSAGGSIGRAMAACKESLLDFKKDMIEIFSSASNNPMNMIFLAENFGKDRESALQRLGVFREWQRDILVFRELQDFDMLIHRDIAPATRNFSERMASGDILENIKTISSAESAIEQNANRQLALESMAFCLRMLS